MQGNRGMRQELEEMWDGAFFTIYERDAKVCLCADGDELVEGERGP